MCGGRYRVGAPLTVVPRSMPRPLKWNEVTRQSSSNGVRIDESGGGIERIALGTESEAVSVNDGGLESSPQQRTGNEGRRLGFAGGQQRGASVRIEQLPLIGPAAELVSSTAQGRHGRNNAATLAQMAVDLADHVVRAIGPGQNVDDLRFTITILIGDLVCCYLISQRRKRHRHAYAWVQSRFWIWVVRCGRLRGQRQRVSPK
jgi:hypothetical protein